MSQDTETMEDFPDERDSEFDVSTTPSLFSQNALSDLVRDLNILKERPELIAFRLKEKNLLSQILLEIFYRDSKEEFLPFLTQKMV